MEWMRLDELARRLREDDPGLARALKDGATAPDVSSPERTRRPEMRRLVMGVAVLVVLAAVVAGTAGVAAVAAALIAGFGVRALWRRTRRPR
jgi:Flp pilus assembly protein TadB